MPKQHVIEFNQKLSTVKAKHAAQVQKLKDTHDKKLAALALKISRNEAKANAKIDQFAAKGQKAYQKAVSDIDKADALLEQIIALTTATPIEAGKAKKIKTLVERTRVVFDKYLDD